MTYQASRSISRSTAVVARLAEFSTLGLDAKGRTTFHPQLSAAHTQEHKQNYPNLDNLEHKLVSLP